MVESNNSSENPKWRCFIREYLSQVQVFIFGIVYLALFRIVLIAGFSSKLAPGTSFGDIGMAMAHGFRFDSSIAALFMLVPFLANGLLCSLNLTAWSVYLRKGFTGLMLLSMSYIFVVTIPYFKEFDNQFDFFLFEILYDDRTAVMRTLIEGYNLFFQLLVFAVLSVLCFFLMGRWLRLSFTPLLGLLTRSKHGLARLLIVILMVLLTFTAARGSLRARPAMRKWADITADTFLNKTVMNPFRHLIYAYKDFKSINSKTKGQQKLLGKMSAKTAAEEYFSLNLPEDQAHDLSNYLLKTVSGSPNKRPDHIFIIVMESYDSWPLLPEYGALNISDSLKALGQEGIFFNHFLPSGPNTMASLSTILTGIPHTGVNISRIGAKRAPFVTATPEIFKRLGYKTRFFYGGFLSWQNIGNLFQAQGIDEIYAGPSMDPVNADGVWGIDDEQLFKFVETHTGSKEKTFNIILTTSYHPPFSLDVKSKGFELEKIPPDVEPSFDGSMTVNQLGHIWYGDREAGKFVNALEKAHPSSLFALTGDHYGRRFLNTRPSTYEYTSVPFILYGKALVPAQEFNNPTPGSHLDIIPTLVELIAPDGFQYHSFGRSLLKEKDKTQNSTPPFGLGYQTLVTEYFISNLKFDRHPAPLPDASFEYNETIFKILVKKHDQLVGLGWWLIFRGKNLETAVVSE